MNRCLVVDQVLIGSLVRLEIKTFHFEDIGGELFDLRIFFFVFLYFFRLIIQINVFENVIIFEIAFFLSNI